MTRANILQTAYEMYRSRELVHGDERLATVLEQLGYTTGAGYQIWANQAAFRRDLAIYVAENIAYTSFESLTARIVELASDGLPFEEHVLAAGDLFVDELLSSEDFYLRLRFFAMGDDRPSDITLAMRQGYERSTCELGKLLAVSLDRFGRRLREPLEIADLTAAVVAALEGYALRDRVQPERVARAVPRGEGTHHIFSLVLLAILNELTAPASTEG